MATGSAAFAAGAAFFFGSTATGLALAAGLAAFDGMGFLAVMRFLEWSRAAARGEPNYRTAHFRAEFKVVSMSVDAKRGPRDATQGSNAGRAGAG
ncbi:MAG TPA: hypothetical protein VGO85_11740 [Caldimonas sp.]|nr:hypothetical protein [Caldimonas sp.]